MVHYTDEKKRQSGYGESPNPKIRKQWQRTLVSWRLEKQVLESRQRSAPGEGEAYRRRQNGNCTVSWNGFER